AGVFASRLFVAFFSLCFAWPALALLFVYLHHNLAALQKFGVNIQLAPIDGFFFAAFLGVQAFALGGLMTVLVAPGLVAPDLTNGAMPLILARPITRTGYTLAKLATLGTLLSLITWIPGLLLFVLEAWFDGWRWLADNLWLAGAIVIGPGIWILTIS